MRERRSNDRERFAQAVLACKQRLWRYALRLTRDQVEAEDLVQSTYLKAFENWQQLRDLDAAGAWIVRAMHRVHLDICRREAKAPMASCAHPEWLERPPARAAATCTAETRGMVQEALAHLPQAFAQALALREVWGFSYDEIATILDCPVGTVRSRIARARLHILQDVDEEETTSHQCRQREPL